jgi:hypothetical protein
VATFDDVRRIALSLPETSEIVTWDVDITFRIGKKIFVIGGDGSSHASIKASLDSQSDLVYRDPETFAPAPYVGRYGWINVDLERLDVVELEGLIRQAWRMTAPKRLAATLVDV